MKYSSPMSKTSRPAKHFERLYRADPDPWGFANSRTVSTCWSSGASIFTSGAHKATTPDAAFPPKKKAHIAELNCAALKGNALVAGMQSSILMRKEGEDLCRKKK